MQSHAYSGAVSVHCLLLPQVTCVLTNVEVLCIGEGHAQPLQPFQDRIPSGLVGTVKGVGMRLRHDSYVEENRILARMVDDHRSIHQPEIKFVGELDKASLERGQIPTLADVKKLLKLHFFTENAANLPELRACR